MLQSLAALLQQHNLGDGEALRQLQQLMMQQQAALSQQASSAANSATTRQQMPVPGAGSASYPPPKYKPGRVTAGDIASSGISGSSSNSSGAGSSTAGCRDLQAQPSAAKGTWSNAQQGAPELGQYAASEPLPATAGMSQEQLAQLAAWGAEGMDTAALLKLHSM